MNLKGAVVPSPPWTLVDVVEEIKKLCRDFQHPPFFSKSVVIVVFFSYTLKGVSMNMSTLPTKVVFIVNVVAPIGCSLSESTLQVGLL